MRTGILLTCSALAIASGLDQDEEWGGPPCPGSAAFIHAQCQVTATAQASCDTVRSEIEGRISGQNDGSWVDPHNAGIYSLTSSSSTQLHTERSTNPATSVGGITYIDKQLFTFKDNDDGTCKVEACSESQSTSVEDFSTNYCDIHNLYAGASFSIDETKVSPSLGAGKDVSACVVVPSKEEVKQNVEEEWGGPPCPGSAAFIHAQCQVTATAQASCDTVMSEIEGRISGQDDGSWVDPHNAGIYSLTSSSSTQLHTERSTNPATSVGGITYIDKQLFTFKDNGDGTCKVEACSESQSTSVEDFSTNYCDIHNLYAGASFSTDETKVSPSLGAGKDVSACVVVPSKEAKALRSDSSKMYCPGSESFIHASAKVTATAKTTCNTVIKEIQRRIDGQEDGSWVDPHNGGHYSWVYCNDQHIHTMRSTNPATAVGGKTYYDMQEFNLADNDDGTCEIQACSESQSFSIDDLSTNYCDIHNLYDGADFEVVETKVSPSLGAGKDVSQCIQQPSVEVVEVV